ncbi:PIN domain-containing protein [Rhizobium sp. LjRoot254]|uniref:PIN domain-containing protein n=1 Tax=Rhizobium sp. LjRoot254 TaxID=3342297 RepID=UPI003ED0CD0D
MPLHDAERIKLLIRDGSISAVTVDTAIFDQYGCKLNHPVLARLDQVKKGGVRLVLSNVVLNEVTKHIAEGAADTARTLRSALKQHERRWQLGKNLDDAIEEFQLAVDPVVLASEQIIAYVEAVGAELIPGEGNGDLAAEVLRRYFIADPPFEKSEKKKHEFPDAFALLSLEQSAKERQTTFLCVSPDRGWAAFAEKSDHLVVFPKLDVVLSWFNDPGRHVADRVIGIWKNRQPANLTQEISAAFENFLDGLRFDVRGHGPLDYEAEPIGAVLQYIDLDQIGQPSVLLEDEDEVDFVVSVVAVVGFEAQFDFYVYDSSDDENVNVGTEIQYAEDALLFEVNLVVSRKVDGEQLEVLFASISSPRIIVDFGYVDPFKDEDPTHEKY